MRLSLLSAILRIRTSPDTMLLGPRAAFGRGGDFALESEEEIRRRLIRALADPASLDALRRFWGQWQSEASRVLVLSDRDLIARVATLAARGPLAAYVARDASVTHTPGASAQQFAARRRRAEAAVGEALRRAATGGPGTGPLPPMPGMARPAVSAGLAAPPSPSSGTAALQGVAVSAFRVSAMVLEQRLEEVLRRAAGLTASDAAAREAVRLLQPAKVAMTVMVLAVWAGSDRLAIGFILDAAAMVAGLRVMGWTIVNAADKLHEALQQVRSARTERDLAAAADLIAQVITAFGVDRFLAMASYAAGRIAGVAQPAKTGLSREVAETRPPPQRLLTRTADHDEEEDEEAPLAKRGGKKPSRAEARKKAIEQAKTDATKLLKKALADVKKWDRKAKARSRKWFGDADAATQKLLQERLEKEIDKLDSFTAKNFRRAEKGEEDCYAYVYPDKDDRIYLGKDFDGAPATGPDSKAGTLIHEISHYDSVGGTDDVVMSDGTTAYGQESCKKLAKEDPDGAKKNADSFEYFVEGQ
jgi:hypothetical protein